MTLEQLYYLAELVGTLAVIASLIYVAREVRQNTAMMRANASQSWTDLNFQLSGPVAENRELAECWVKGENEFDQLDEVDQLRLIMYEWRALESWHHLFYLHEQGVLPEPQWRKLLWVFENLGQRQAVRASWQHHKDAYDKEFQTLMNQYIKPL